jgi:hypothetical protein
MSFCGGLRSSIFDADVYLLRTELKPETASGKERIWFRNFF